MIELWRVDQGRPEPHRGGEQPGGAKARPPRFPRPSPLQFVLFCAGLAFFLASFRGADVSFSHFARGVPNLVRLIGEMLPPDPSRIGLIAERLFQTFQMALVGTAFGIVASAPLAVFASRVHAPLRILYYLARAAIALARTVPDIVWALFCIVLVGLGPFAGTLAIAIETIGFCGRFFAEAMEDADPGPQEALAALGATRVGIIVSAVVPAALPSLINVSLFSLEKSTRSSVVLGIVGAGGIGVQLKVAMDFFHYNEAAMIIIAIFVLVSLVEHLSALLRASVLGRSAVRLVA